jgi:hypothetical protein
MGVEKIARLQELDHERGQLVKRLVALDQEMTGIIGTGFDIPGGRVVPLKRKRKLDYGGSPLTPGPTPTVKATNPGDFRAAQTVALAYLDANPLKMIGAELVMTELNAKGLASSIDQARNALYWLYKDGKCARPERGKYQALKKK